MSGRGALQSEVRRTMIDAGGYWRPLAAVARLLEELGELVELLEVPEKTAAAGLPGELADLWIITTALADQFLIEVADPAPTASRAAGATDALIIAAGPIARVVNYYDGPKTPRAGDRLPSLTDAITGFHRQLGLLCGALGIDLAAAVATKLAIIRGRDLERFAQEAYDPSTASVLELLPAQGAMKLWGSPELDRAAGAALQARALAPSLRAFTKAAGPEGLDGYVVRAPSPAGSAVLEAWLDELLDALTELDPAWGPSGSDPGERGLQVDVLPAPEGGALVVLGLQANGSR